MAYQWEKTKKKNRVSGSIYACLDQIFGDKSYDPLVVAQQKSRQIYVRTNL